MELETLARALGCVVDDMRAWAEALYTAFKGMLAFATGATLSDLVQDKPLWPAGFACFACCFFCYLGERTFLRIAQRAVTLMGRCVDLRERLIKK